ncbi:hypothetical protein Tco_1036441 [Tanacetum coccineum]
MNGLINRVRGIEIGGRKIHESRVDINIMSITKDQQQALDDALVPREQRRRIGKDMLQICPNLLGQKFVDPPFEEEILAFIRKLGHTGDIKLLTDFKIHYYKNG